MSPLRKHRVFLFWQFTHARPAAGLAALEESLGMIEQISDESLA